MQTPQILLYLSPATRSNLREVISIPTSHRTRSRLSEAEKVSGSSARGGVRVGVQIRSDSQVQAQSTHPAAFQMVKHRAPFPNSPLQECGPWWPLNNFRSLRRDRGLQVKVSVESPAEGLVLAFNSSLLLGVHPPGLHPLSDCGAGPGQPKHSWHLNLGTTEMSLEFPRWA